MALAVMIKADLLRKVEHRPEILDPRPHPDYQSLKLDRTLVLLNGRYGTGSQAKPRHLDAGLDLGEPLHGPAVVGVAGFFFVHKDGNAPGLPVKQDVLHVLHARGLALDQLGRITDVEMGLVHRSNLFVQGLRTEEQSADGVIAVCCRIALPDLDAVLHQLAHGWLEIVVAHNAACDSRGARPNSAFVNDEDVHPASLPPRL